MAHDRQQPVIPPRPSYLDDEDEAIKQAIAESLVTAREDDKRRQERYGFPGSGEIPPARPLHAASSMPNVREELSTNQQQGNTSSGTISRPRPRPSATGTGTLQRDHSGVQIAAPAKTSRPPIIPPRPGMTDSSTLPPRPKKTTQAELDVQVKAPTGQTLSNAFDKAILSDLKRPTIRVPSPAAMLSGRSDSRNGVKSASPDFSDFMPSHRSQSVPPGADRSGFLTPELSPVLPRKPSPSPPAPVSSAKFTTPGKTSELDKPLITFSPRNMDPSDFDLDSLDPLKAGYKENLPVSKEAKSAPISNDSLAKKLLFKDDALGVPDFQRSSSASCLSTLDSQSTGKTNPINPYSTHIPQGMLPNLHSQVSLMKTESNLTPPIPPRPCTPGASIAMDTSPRPERKYPTYAPMTSATSSAAPQSSTNQAILTVSKSLVSEMKLTDNKAYSTVDPSIFLQQPSPSTEHPKLDDGSSRYLVPDNLGGLTEVSTRQSVMSTVSDASSGYTIPDGAMVFHKPTAGDLMDFPTQRTNYDYLSLECFDPLYSVEKSIDEDREESTESLSLFPNPLDRLQRKNTPNPFPSINSITTQSLMRNSSLCDINSSTSTVHKAGIEASGSRASLEVSGSRTSLEATGSRSSQSPDPKVMEESSHELQDPFSVPDLLKALERKRQEHAKAQAERQTELKEQERQAELAREQALAKEQELQKERSEAHSCLRPNAGRRHDYHRRSSYIQVGEESSYEILHDFPETANEEVQAFCGMVASIKMQYRNTDESTNPGVVISSRCNHPTYKSMTVKLLVKARFIEEPGYPFTCDVNATVSHAIGAVLLSTDNMGSGSTDEYVFKVHGMAEYLINDTVLADYVYVQECMKLDVDIKFVLIKKSQMVIPFKRTPEDDRNALFVPKSRDMAEKGMKITKDKLNILMETFYKEVEKLRDTAIQGGLDGVRSKSVIQTVKAICAVLYKMESIDILRAIDRLQSLNLEKTLHPTSVHDSDTYAHVTKDGSSVIPVRDSETVRKISDLDDLHIALEEMTMAVKALIELYCRTFHTDFRFRSTTQVIRDQRESSDCLENLIVHIATVGRIPHKVKSAYSDFKIICGLYYGGQRLAQEVVTSVRPSWAPIFGDTLIWDEWLLFDSVMVCSLPREARLCLTLIGVKVVQVSSSDQPQRVTTPLGWVGLQLFNYDFKLTQGSQLLGLWPGDLANPTGTSIPNTETPYSMLLQVNMPQFDCDYIFPAIQTVLPSVKQDFESLHPNDQELVTCVLEKDSITRLTPQEGEFLWEKRHFLYMCPAALPRVIQQVTSWYWGALTESYSMIAEWNPLSPEQALELLLPHYPDTFVRDNGANWVGQAMTDELCDYLPQLVQALKFESYHTSSLARLLLEKAICSVRIAHQLYWLLKEAADDICYRKRYQLMFGAVLSVVGEGMRKELAKQEDTVKMFSAIAEKVKAAKDKEGVLSRELFNMWEFLQYESVRLPLNPAMEIQGIDVKSCSYFTSFTFPLKLVLKNADAKADAHYAMFKVGDDLRQDMLTMQLIDVMDKLWLKEGLDLKMITFKCVHTGIKKGLVEIITESETLRKIQTKHGIAGSFKDRPIAEWLQLQNPTELEYQKACDNFTASCAGYCVATYILGIGDRHNDNIMIKQSGHLFHIDFAKFLGDSQMIGNIKRDRVPFVLTSDMAFVINGGDKRPSHKFQHFVDLCCQAFNILRHHGNLFINLLSMMSLSGIPGVTESAGKYVQKVLLPDASDAEATAVFTRMIHDSMKSTFTQFNFFMHNLAQMKFHGHSDGGLLSFIPKTYSLDQDGRIKHVEIHGIQKRYSPEKFYIYIIRVERVNQAVPNLVFRRYSEFQELHHKLVVTYPLIRLPSLHNRVLLGRTHVRHVAEERRAELELFLQELLKLAPEISESDLIYTFFHPMLRDEQDAGKTNLQKLKESSPVRTPSRAIQGQVKLSITYKNNQLTVMVMHVKDLGTTSNGDAPDPYVKFYMLPDPMKVTKRKTKIQKHTFHPTYNEMFYYHMTLEEIKTRTLQCSVWNYDKMKENEFLGATFIRLSDLDLNKERAAWYHLQALHSVSMGGR